MVVQLSSSHIVYATPSFSCSLPTWARIPHTEDSLSSTFSKIAPLMVSSTRCSPAGKDRSYLRKLHRSQVLSETSLHKAKSQQPIPVGWRFILWSTFTHCFWCAYLLAMNQFKPRRAKKIKSMCRKDKELWRLKIFPKNETKTKQD